MILERLSLHCEKCKDVTPHVFHSEQTADDLMSYEQLYLCIGKGCREIRRFGLTSQRTRRRSQSKGARP